MLVSIMRISDALSQVAASTSELVVSFSLRRTWKRNSQMPWEMNKPTSMAIMMAYKIMPMASKVPMHMLAILKTAPELSSAKNKKLMPMTLPSLWRSSQYGGSKPTHRKTVAKMPKMRSPQCVPWA